MARRIFLIWKQTGAIASAIRVANAIARKENYFCKSVNKILPVRSHIGKIHYSVREASPAENRYQTTNPYATGKAFLMPAWEAIYLQV
ncbi:MAG: hypothetical protein KME54_04915 [Tolypothrix brevis GSE-NOS-MK-07-07A]|nr:hypothetical protein [Tolypothrix brevis GSE-NOS-MK-07-07A]